jgi:hypothetical protein
MEIIQNRYGQDRVIEKISPTKLRITGESLIVRDSYDENGKLTMFDFEGGPCLNVGGTIKYLKSEWVIKEILPQQQTQPNLISVLLTVELNG